MHSLTPSREPSLPRALRGLVVGLFGILWTVVGWHLTADSNIPYVAVAVPLFGVLITLMAWSQAAYHFVHLAGQQRFAEYDFVTLEDQPATVSAASQNCPHCRASLQPAFRYCPMCGTKV